MDFLKPATVLDLKNIRDELVRMEDTIIFKFIERSHFPTCPTVYSKNDPKLPIRDFDGSFLDWALMHSEITHSRIRRFESPDQTPFFPDSIQEPILPSIQYPRVLASYSSEINFNDSIKDVYIKQIIPMISKYDGESWENFGSVATIDIECLQSLSRRIHFGKFVAEAKFQADRAVYSKMIQEKDIEGIYQSITNSAVEEKILERLCVKAEVYGVDPTNKEGHRKITPEYLVKIYKELVIPLTKQVEVDYLLRRLECE
ncbi:Chorismate mutase [Lachancea thermotolerans]|uniref:Chorismate mutase n=1 Tax=Lachancea thermotolerans (strain ATCC 56472 / CBS 6340 / NRRL Y-8284) TaxID=559295 RepID=C5DIU4_LACTC|nr:KLTH0E15246p [Lachancea thermotolerans CBS 6340]CAR23705.1 KLTH0E15246p [Lachancea thermotolerans CBS 6340]